MNIVVGAIIAIVATTLTCSAMLFVRRRAPQGSYFTDGDRASGVFGVLATGFSVLLGFIIFLAFDSYDQARTGAETESTICSALRLISCADSMLWRMPVTTTSSTFCSCACAVTARSPAPTATDILEPRSTTRTVAASAGLRRSSLSFLESMFTPKTCLMVHA